MLKYIIIDKTRNSNLMSSPLKLKKTMKINIINKNDKNDKNNVKHNVKHPVFAPKLYHLAATGKIYSWVIDVIETEDGYGKINTEYGELEGKKIHSSDVIKEGKRIGTKGETTAFEQACKMAMSKWKKKMKQKYYETIEEAQNVVYVSPMLAHKFEMKNLNKKRGTNITTPAIGQPKLDGWRCIAKCVMSKNKCDIEMKTRSNTLYDTGNFQHIVNELKRGYKGRPELSDLYLDGELYTIDVPFEELGLLKSKDKSKKQNEKFALVKYFVYDCFFVDNLKMPFIERYELLKHFTTNCNNVILVENIKINSENDIVEAHSKYVAMGYEGLMLRNIESPYDMGKRSKNLQKYKQFDEDEFEIVGFKEASGEDIGTIVFQCKTNIKSTKSVKPKKGNNNQTFDVRPKGSREYRRELFENGDKYIGKQLTVVYFGMTKYGIPRMPVGKAIREDK